MNSPQDVVEQFIADYDDWNSKAFQVRAQANGDELIEQSYAALIAKYCGVNVEPQGEAYGSQSMHSLAQEQVVNVQQTELNALVLTKHRSSNDFISHYEYHLAHENGEWRLTSLLYVDGQGKYECL